MTDPASNDLRALLRRSLEKVAELRAELATRADPHEPIALVGMGCRFPGGGDSPAAFWRALVDGVDAIREVPPGRWPRDPAFDRHPATRWAGYLDDVAGFDAAFFGVSPREAASLDPQQRLLLEVAWEALEHAGQPPTRLLGSRTGVFVGITTLDYQQRILTAEPDELDVYALTGNSQCFAAGRLSYVLGLQGPCVALDTACSSSLTAVHLACQSLRARECELALAGGVNLVLSPVATHMLAQAQALSPGGRCRTFDAGADGFVRGEGCGVVALKRLADARRDGDRIWALIRGSAVNQDGRSTGLTAPNVRAQEALLRQALGDAGVTPAQVGYLETHGTGTPLGDPIEIEAIKAVYGAPRPAGDTCVLGALKTCVGHLEAAAGVAGLIKVVLAMHHRQIPRNLHFEAQNPRISLTDVPLALASEAHAWPGGDAPRIAGVSAFGFSGTNAHVVLQEPPPAPAAPPAPAVPRLLPLSARSPQALQALARALVDQLATNPDPAGLRDLAYTASERRDHHPHRLAVAGASASELADGLAAHLRGEAPRNLAVGHARPGVRPRVVWLFPGMGTRCAGVGRELLAEEPAFARALLAADAEIEPHLGRSLRALLESGDDVSDRVDLLQPLLFAVEYALAALWQAWGVRPDAVVGHSMGEITAACVAGALSLADAARVVCSRSRLLRAVSGRGGMAVVELAPTSAAASVAAFPGLAVAAHNGARSTVVSGPDDALDRWLARVTDDGVGARRLKVDIAFHGPQMDPLCPPLREALAALRPTSGDIPIYSTVTGERVEGTTLTASHWLRNLREPVAFAAALERLLADEHTLFVEVSPRPSLLTTVQATLRERSPASLAVATLRSGLDERTAMLTALGAMYTRGHPVAWARHVEGGRVTSLPTYPWQRERHWIDRSPRMAATRPTPATALGEHIELAEPAGAHLWQQTLDLRRRPWLRDHRVHDVVVVSGAVLLDMAAEAVAAALGPGPHTLQDIHHAGPLELSESAPRELQLALYPAADGAHLTISSRPGPGPWTPHLRARVAPGPGDEQLTDLVVDPSACVERAPADFYARLAAHGTALGPSFRGVQRLWCGDGVALAQVHAPVGLVVDPERPLHPAVMDACVHALMAVHLFDPAAPRGALVGGGVERVHRSSRPGDLLWSHIRLRPQPPGSPALVADIRIVDAAGRLVAEVCGLHMHIVDLGRSPPVDAPARATWSDLRDAPPAQRLAALRDHVRAAVAAVLRREPATTPTDASLQDLGFDSLLAVELREALHAALGRGVPVALLWRHPSVDELALALADLVTADVPSPPEP